MYTEHEPCCELQPRDWVPGSPLFLWEDAACLEQNFPDGVKEVLTGVRVETGMNGQDCQGTGGACQRVRRVEVMSPATSSKSNIPVCTLCYEGK